MISTRPLTSKFPRLFNNPLVTIPKASITIGIIVTFMFQSFFNTQAKSMYTFFQFYSGVSRESKVNNFASSLFLVDYYKVLGVVAIEKGAFRSPSTMVTNFYYKVWSSGREAQLAAQLN